MIHPIFIPKGSRHFQNNISQTPRHIFVRCTFVSRSCLHPNCARRASVQTGPVSFDLHSVCAVCYVLCYSTLHGVVVDESEAQLEPRFSIIHVLIRSETGAALACMCAVHRRRWVKCRVRLSSYGVGWFDL